MDVMVVVHSFDGPEGLGKSGDEVASGVGELNGILKRSPKLNSVGTTQ